MIRGEPIRLTCVILIGSASHLIMLWLFMCDAGLAFFGCFKCRHAAGGCADCNPALLEKQIQRKELESLVCSPMDMPVLTSEPEWRFRYYESAPATPSAGDCGQIALTLMSLIAGKPLAGLELPSPESKLQQTGAQCSFHVLHAIEEESRRKLGLPCWSAAFNVEYRVERVTSMRQKLHSGSGAD